MNRSRLFFVLDSLEENEVADQVATLLGRLPRSRFDPRVVSLGPRGALGSRLRDMTITVHRLELSGAAGAVLAVPRLRRLLKGLRAELLHTFQPWSGTVAQLAAPPDARVFRWVQDFPPAAQTLEQRLQAWLERRAAFRAGRRVVVGDPDARALVMEHFRVDDVPVVPQCVDLGLVRERVLRVRSREARIHLGMAEGQRAIVCFSDFRGARRMSQVLEGFALARTELPGLRLFIHGRGPEEGGPRWQAEDLHLEDSVIFLGAPTQQETALRVAEIVVDAGSWPGWCRGAVEAMALGLPVLRWVDDPEAPTSGRYASVTTGPAERFARDVLALMNDDELRTQVAQRCAAAAQQYDVATVADRWTELYAS